MKRLNVLAGVAALAAAVAVSACGGTAVVEEPAGGSAVELFERAADAIITLATEEPVTVVKTVLGEVEVTYDVVFLGEEPYYPTTGDYQTLREHYGEIFTGEALDWVLSTKFAQVDGALYVSPVGGATGFRITDLAVAEMGEEGGKRLCQATFRQFDEETTCHFTVEETEAGARIGRIDYRPEGLRPLEQMVCPEGENSNPST